MVYKPPADGLPEVRIVVLDQSAAVVPTQEDSKTALDLTIAVSNRDAGARMVRARVADEEALADGVMVLLVEQLLDPVRLFRAVV